MNSIPSILTTKQVAERLGVSEQHIRTLLRCGEMEGLLLGKQWLVTSEAVDLYVTHSNATAVPCDHARRELRLPELKALSFFSGAMGLDTGLEKAGFNVLLACENDKSCRMTIEANRPDIALLGDIWKYTASDIREEARLSPEDTIDVVAGGPPCQSFSTAGARRGFNDQRGNALLKYVELILELHPRYAIIENVRGILSAPLIHRPHSERGEDNPILSKDELPGGVLLHILEILQNAGYGVTFNLYNSANFGSPQIRERVVMICHSGGNRLPYVIPTHSQDGRFGLPKWRTFSDAVAGLDIIKHHHVDFPESRLRFYRMLGPGQYWKHLPEDMQKEALGKSYYSGGGKTGFFRRLAWDKPSPTLVTHPAMPATDLAHPTENRPLSIEEYKRIQEFPDDWIVCGKLVDQYRQIGNAVPVSLGTAIGRTIIAHMKGEVIPSFAGFHYSRYIDTDDITWEKRTRAILNAYCDSCNDKQLDLELVCP